MYYRDTVFFMRYQMYYGDNSVLYEVTVEIFNNSFKENWHVTDLNEALLEHAFYLTTLSLAKFIWVQ